MIHSVTVTNHLGESLEMILTQPELSGLIIKNIDGMGPADATVNLTEMATVDGSIVNSSKLSDKEIKIDLIFLEHPTIEDTRLLTYKYFPIKRPITLTFKTIRPGDNVRITRIFGIVEKNEPKVFQKQESCSITIKCADPYFHSLEQSNEMFFGVEPLFEFTYSNEIDEDAESDYITVDTYDEYGNNMTNMYEYRQVGEPFNPGPMSGKTIRYDRQFENVDKLEIVLTRYEERSPNIITEVCHVFATSILTDPDNRVIKIPNGERKEVYKSIDEIIDVERDFNDMSIYFIKPLSFKSYIYELTITSYNLHSMTLNKVIYYEDFGLDTYSSIGRNEEIVHTYRYDKLDLRFLLNGRPEYTGSVTMIDTDPDTTVTKIADGATDIELYNSNILGQLLISRTGDKFILKAIGSAAGNIERSLTVNKYNAYEYYKDIYHTEFGNLSSITEGNIWYDGDSETGLIIDIIFHGNATNMAIYDKETGEMMAIDDAKLHDIVGYIQYGDIIRINTNIGKKSVTYIRKDQTFDILNTLIPPLQWFKLTQGDNIFAYYADTGLENLVFDIRYDILYGGI